MTYARARLWLGITGVGSLVTLAMIALLSGIPQSSLSISDEVGGRELLQLAGVIGLFMLWLMPLDFLGGFWIPRKFQKSEESFGAWLSSYIVAALTQAFLFVVFGALILLLSQWLGAAGGGIAISLGIAACFIVRNRLLLNREARSEPSAQKLLDAIALIQSWQIFVPRTVVVEHQDVGFHPVPNVASRNRSEPIRGLEAWNVARTTLFFSWACLGVLSRSVHCNVGRPELWTMLPTD